MTIKSVASFSLCHIESLNEIIQFGFAQNLLKPTIVIVFGISDI